MKKFIHTLTVALVVSTCAVAQGLSESKNMLEAGTRHAKAIMQNSRVADVKAPAGKAAHRLPTPTGTADDIIYEPDGVRSDNLVREDVSYFNIGGELYLDNVTGVVSHYVVSADGNSIYMRPISTWNAGGYIRLDRQADGTYTAHTPQIFYDQDNGDGTHLLVWATRLKLHTYDDGKIWYEPEDNGDGSYNTDMRFTFEDGVLSQADMTTTGGLPNEILAMTDSEGSWLLYGSGCISISPLADGDKPAVLPGDNVQQAAMLSYGNIDMSTGGMTVVSKPLVWAVSASEPGAVYVKGLSNTMPEQWVKGELGGDGGLTFRKQYLGINQDQKKHLWLMPALYTVDAVPSGGAEYYIPSYTMADAVTLEFNAATQTYRSTENEALTVSMLPSRVNYTEAFNSPVITLIDDKAATPAAPADAALQSTTYGYVRMQFTLSPTDVDGRFIDTGKLYYRVFIGGDETTPFVFNAGTYHLDEDMTDIPYGFNNGIASISSYNNSHYFNIYDPGVTLCGVQSVYKGGGEERVSDIIWVDMSGTGITSVTADEAAKVEYYDLQGRHVDNPAKGIFIKKTTTANGTKTIKVMK